MTPLEKAQQAQKEPPVCSKCPVMVKVGNLCYCGASGLILLPSLLEMSICQGERLKFEYGKWSKR